jgi:hypothetical protein
VPTALSRCEHVVVAVEELRALRDRHPKVLIVGPDADAETVLSELDSVVRPPITSIRVDNRFVLPSLLACGPLILRNLTALTWEDQHPLHDWMERTNDVMQIVATSAIPLLPLLERGSFLDTLYYHLERAVRRGRRSVEDQSRRCLTNEITRQAEYCLPLAMI